MTKLHTSRFLGPNMHILAVRHAPVIWNFLSHSPVQARCCCARCGFHSTPTGFTSTGFRGQIDYRKEIDGRPTVTRTADISTLARHLDEIMPVRSSLSHWYKNAVRSDETLRNSCPLTRPL